MLTDVILSIIYFVVSGFAGLLPDVSLSDNIATSISTAAGYATALDNFVPLATIAAIMGLVLTIELVMLSIKVINWFIRKIPTIN